MPHSTEVHATDGGNRVWAQRGRLDPPCQRLQHGSRQQLGKQCKEAGRRSSARVCLGARTAMGPRQHATSQRGEPRGTPGRTQGTHTRTRNMLIDGASASAHTHSALQSLLCVPGNGFGIPSSLCTTSRRSRCASSKRRSRSSSRATSKSP